MHNSVTSSANKDMFTSLFPLWMTFIISSYLIAVARISSTIMNKSGKGSHPCLDTYLKRNSCSFCPLRIMLAVGLSYMAFIMLWCVPSVPTAEKFLS